MTTWLETLWRDPPSGGLILFLESMESGELQAASAWLKSHPQTPALLVVGARGLIGAEELLQHGEAKLLPLPWTVAGLRQLIGIPRPPAPQTLQSGTPRAAKEIEASKNSSDEGDESDDSASSKSEIPSDVGDRVHRPNYSHSGGAGFSPCRPASELPKSVPEAEPEGNPKSGQPLPSAKQPASPTSDSGLQRPQSRLTQLQAATPQPRKTSAPPSRSNPAAALQTDAFAGEFLDGLVERFRDPLASLSGYLQMLNGNEQQNQSLVEPALRAAKEIETALEVLYLASDSHPSKPGKVSGEHLAIEALKEAQRAGLSVQLALDEDFLLRTDQELVRAGLQCARALLNLFGGANQSEMVLHCRRDKNWAILQWHLAEPAAPNRAGTQAPPPFLGLLLKRFADKLGAEPVLISTEHQVPRVVGLAWSAEQTLSPL